MKKLNEILGIKYPFIQVLWNHFSLGRAQRRMGDFYEKAQ